MNTVSNNKPKVGFWILTALVTGNMIGSGVFLLPSSLSQFGTISILAWMFTAGGALLLALVFANLSRLIPKVGGPYAYCYAGFGEFIGFLVAYNYWIAVWVGNAAIATAFVGYLSVFFPILTANHFYQFLSAAAVVWGVTLVNIRGVGHAGMLQLVTTVLKITPLIAIAIAGLFYANGHELLKTFNVSGESTFTALTSAAALTLWSFIGLESATVPAENAADPTRMIPRATIIGTAVTALIYILSTIAVMSIVALPVLKTSSAPYAECANIIFGVWGKWIVAAGAVISCFGALNGWTLLQGQIPMAAARDGLFPKLFAKETANGSPYLGLIISSIFITGLLALTLNKNLVTQFTFIILLATFSNLIPYFFTAMSALLLLRKFPGKYTGKTASVIAILAGIYTFWTIVGAGSDIVYWGILLTFAGIPLYVWMKRRAD